MKTKRNHNGNGDGQLEMVLGQFLPLDSIKPAPENDEVYRVIPWDDPELHQLADSIRAHGIQESLLVSRDGYLISGHRRRMAAQLAGIVQVPVRVHTVSRAENRAEFVRLLVEMNSQRIKSGSELLQETLIKIDPVEAHQKIVNERKEKDLVRSLSSLDAIDPWDDGQSSEISLAKELIFAAVLRVLEAQRAYWPLSDRQIHYRLLGPEAPLTHSSKPNSKYINDKASYRKLTDLLARGRIDGLIPWVAIEDVTRPVNVHSAFVNSAEFFRQEFKNLLQGYWRNLQQSQPHHIEIVAEKLTAQTILQAVAKEHTIPLTITRGMSSLPPKKDIYDRYRFSKKQKLVLLIVSDLDPAGDAIADDLIKSFRRDFGIDSEAIEGYKVALTIDQVAEFNLSPSMEAKDSGPTYSTFVDKYGITDAYELEAMQPADLAESLTNAIDEVLDTELYNQEVAAEEADSAQIVAVQEQAAKFFESLNIDH